MKHALLFITTIITMAFSAVAPAYVFAQEKTQRARTIRSEMEVIHEKFGVNFVFDSSIDLNIPYSGRPVADMISGKRSTVTPDSDRSSLELCLETLFKGTDIEYEIMKKYIVLTQADKRRKPKDYTIFIEEQHDTLSGSVITALIDPKRNSTQTGLKRIDSRTINSGFALFGTPDVVKTLQMMPGVSSGTELLSGFYVHGGDGSDNLFLLDGVPIYQSSHLLGLFSSFNSDVIESMDFYKSGFPARYGSKMSSVVDITTKDGDFKEYHGLFSIGLIDGRFQLDGPIWKDKTSFNIGLRRTWTETVTMPIMTYLNKVDSPDKNNFRYAFTDLNAKITHKFSDRSVLSANYYTGKDVFKYLYDDYSYYYTDGYGSERVPTREMIDIHLGWGNTVGSLNWNYNVSDDLAISSKLYYSGSFSGFGYIDEQDEEGKYDMVGMTYNSRVHTVGLKSDVYHKLNDKHRLRYGASAQLHYYRPNFNSVVETVRGENKFKYHPSADSLSYNTFESALYAEDEIAVSDKFSVNVGLRYGLYATNEKVWHSLEPRLAMKYTFNDAMTAKASYTEMSQPSHLISSLYLDLPTNMWLPSTQKIRPSRSREVAAGLYTNLSPTVHLNVEGWYKHMYNLIEYAGPYSIFPPLTDWEYGYKSGQGRSWGTELDFGYSNGKTEVNAYYTLSWSQRKFDDFYRGWYSDRNDNRHKLTLMARHKFTKRFEIYGAWNYHTGNRITLSSHQTPDGINVYPKPNNVKVPDYHRLDVGLNFVKNTKRGNTSIWNLSVYNAYCHLNPISALEEYHHLDNVTLANYGSAVGIIPIIPTFSYTLKF